MSNGWLRSARGFTIRPPLSGEVRPGSTISLAVRPEKVGISRAGEAITAGRNQLPGEIENVVFLGESTTYVVRAGGEQVRAKLFQDASAGIFAVGDEVTLSWRPEDTNVFAGEDEGFSTR